MKNGSKAKRNFDVLILIVLWSTSQYTTYFCIITIDSIHIITIDSIITLWHVDDDIFTVPYNESYRDDNSITGNDRVIITSDEDAIFIVLDDAVDIITSTIDANFIITIDVISNNFDRSCEYYNQCDFYHHY